MRLGVALRANWPLSRALEYAKLADRLGFFRAWTNNPVSWGDPFLTLREVAQNSKRLKLGIAVIDPNGRHPMGLAASSRALYEITGRDLDLGLGTGNPATGKAGLAIGNPIESLKEALTVTRTMLRGQTMSMEGAIFKAYVRDGSSDISSHVSVLVGAQSPKMLQIAAKYADGIVSPKCSDSHDRILLRTYRENLRTAGRNANGSKVVMLVNIAVDRTRAGAIRKVRPMVAEFISHLSNNTHRRLGLTPEFIARCRKDFNQAPDDFVYEYSICGSVDECSEKLKRLKSLGVDEVYLWYPTHPQEGTIRKQLQTRARLLREIADAMPYSH